jgi:hypothetical protein
VFYVEITVHIFLTLRRLMQGARQDDGAPSNNDTDSMPAFFGGEHQTETAMLGGPPPCGGVWGECLCCWRCRHLPLLSNSHSFCLGDPTRITGIKLQ